MTKQRRDLTFADPDEPRPGRSRKRTRPKGLTERRKQQMRDACRRYRAKQMEAKKAGQPGVRKMAGCTKLIRRYGKNALVQLHAEALNYVESIRTALLGAKKLYVDSLFGWTYRHDQEVINFDNIRRERALVLEYFKRLDSRIYFALQHLKGDEYWSKMLPLEEIQRVERHYKRAVDRNWAGSAEFDKPDFLRKMAFSTPGDRRLIELLAKEVPKPSVQLVPPHSRLIRLRHAKGTPLKKRLETRAARLCQEFVQPAYFQKLRAQFEPKFEEFQARQAKQIASAAQQYARCKQASISEVALLALCKEKLVSLIKVAQLATRRLRQYCNQKVEITRAASLTGLLETLMAAEKYQALLDCTLEGYRRDLGIQAVSAQAENEQGLKK